MPHLVLLHSPGLSSKVEELLPELNTTLENLGFSRPGIKAYGLCASSTLIAGQTSADFVHVNLRVMRKPGRTLKELDNWARTLEKRVRRDLPEQATLTAEVEFLPETYISQTA